VLQSNYYGYELERYRVDNMLWDICNIAVPALDLGERSCRLYLSGDVGYDGSRPILVRANSNVHGILIERQVLAVLLHFARKHHLAWRLTSIPKEAR